LNDGEQLFYLITDSFAVFETSTASLEDYYDELLKVMSIYFEGNDISFILLDLASSNLLIYRDLFGKRSLILSYTGSELMISSVRLS